MNSNKSARFALRLTVPMHKHLKIASIATSTSMNNLIEEAIAAYLDKHFSGKQMADVTSSMDILTKEGR